MQNFNLLQQLLENQLIDIEAKDIKIENGIMIPNQFPDKVNDFFCVNLSMLTSLENCPKETNNDFLCDGTLIISLQFGPKIVGGVFSCIDTKITSLDYAPIKCGEIDCRGNNILHLKGIGRSYLKDCKLLALPDTIKSNILGLCRIKNLNIRKDIYVNIKSGDLFDAIKIVKNHLETDGSECAEELIQNGYNDYAKF